MNKACYLNFNLLLEEGKAAVIEEKKNEYVVIKTGDISCPECKNSLMRYGFETRVIHGRSESLNNYTCQKLYCSVCHRIYHLYPSDMVLPKIRYSADFYNEVIQNDKINKECEACDSTQNRWRHNAKK